MQLQAVRSAFTQQFSKDLLLELKRETKGIFQEAVISLFLPPMEYVAVALHSALMGIGYNHVAAIQLLVGLSNQEKLTLRECYVRMFGPKGLNQLIEAEVFGSGMRAMLIGLLAPRDVATVVSEHHLRDDIQHLYAAGEGKLGTDERVFIRIFTAASWTHLVALGKQYPLQTKKQHTLAHALKAEFSGALLFALESVLALAQCNCGDSVGYFAEEIRKTGRQGRSNSNQATLLRLMLLQRFNMQALKLRISGGADSPKSDISDALNSTRSLSTGDLPTSTLKDVVRAVVAHSPLLDLLQALTKRPDEA